MKNDTLTINKIARATDNIEGGRGADDPPAELRNVVEQ